MNTNLNPQIEAKIRLAAQMKTVFSRPQAYDGGIDRVIKIVVVDGTISGLMLGKDGKLLSFKFNPDKNIATYQFADNLKNDSDSDESIREDGKDGPTCKKGLRCKGSCMNRNYVCRNGANKIASPKEIATIKTTALKVEGKDPSDDLENKSIRELQKIASEKGVYRANHQSKKELINNIRVLKSDPENQERLRKTLEKRRQRRKAIEKALPKDVSDVWKGLQKLSGKRSSQSGVGTALVAAAFVTGFTKSKIEQMKQNYQNNLGESAQRAYEQAQKIPLQDVKKPNITFTVGGFAGTGSRGDRLKELLEAPQDNTKGEKWFKDANHIIPVQSNEFDITTPSASKKDANGNYNPMYLGSVAKQGFGKFISTFQKGHNEASVDLAAQLYAYGSKHGTKGMNVLTHQLGGNISAEAIDILNKMKPPSGQKGVNGSDIAKRLNLVNLGTPYFGMSDGKAWKDGTIKHRTITSSGDPFSILPKRAAQWISSVRGAEPDDYLKNPDVRERVREAFNYYSSSLSGRRAAEAQAQKRNKLIGEAIGVVSPPAGKLWDQMSKLQEKAKESPTAAAILGGAVLATTGIASYKVARSKYQQGLSTSAPKAEAMVDAELKKIKHRNANVTIVVGGAGSPSQDIIDSLPESIKGKPSKTGTTGSQTHFVQYDDETALSVKPATPKDLLVSGYGGMLTKNIGKMGVPGVTPGNMEDSEAIALAAQIYAHGKRQYEKHGNNGVVNVLAAGTGGNTSRAALEIVAKMGDRDNKRRGAAIARRVNFVSLGTPSFGLTNEDPGTERNPKFVAQEVNLRGTGDPIAKITAGRSGMATAVEVDGSDAKSYLSSPVVQERLAREFRYGQRERPPAKRKPKPKSPPAQPPAPEMPSTVFTTEIPTTKPKRTRKKKTDSADSFEAIARRYLSFMGGGKARCN